MILRFNRIEYITGINQYILWPSVFISLTNWQLLDESEYDPENCVDQRKSYRVMTNKAPSTRIRWKRSPKTLTFFFFLSKTLSRASVDGWKRRFLKTITSSALDRYKLSRVAVGTKMVTKLYIVFVWSDQKRFRTGSTFGRGFFLKRGQNLQISVFLNVDSVLAGKIFWMK